ncbi:hypothetical protein PGT21_021080 [Puccinia graminis f. sp. tritici]|uniref:Uncharacterized protein n=1 Tax=Puccinia graminis f. sp. tritici TaxID=56615 RepID=A0A5B0LQD2_PUCGR|nr:hypothetical protein PGTUg99_002606 [Puccinia graminis f. sp. tritici]KAA1071843.1 hypothetical protein PGT21_021080 [Puccinia graminis f. sp. tritici]
MVLASTRVDGATFGKVPAKGRVQTCYQVHPVGGRKGGALGRWRASEPPRGKVEMSTCVSKSKSAPLISLGSLLGLQTSQSGLRFSVGLRRQRATLLIDRAIPLLLSSRGPRPRLAELFPPTSASRPGSPASSISSTLIRSCHLLSASLTQTAP